MYFHTMTRMRYATIWLMSQTYHGLLNQGNTYLNKALTFTKGIATFQFSNKLGLLTLLEQTFDQHFQPLNIIKKYLQCTRTSKGATIPFKKEMSVIQTFQTK